MSLKYIFIFRLLFAYYNLLLYRLEREDFPSSSRRDARLLLSSRLTLLLFLLLLESAVERESTTPFHFPHTTTHSLSLTLDHPPCRSLTQSFFIVTLERTIERLTGGLLSLSAASRDSLSCVVSCACGWLSTLCVCIFDVSRFFLLLSFSVCGGGPFWVGGWVRTSGSPLTVTVPMRLNERKVRSG